MEGRRDGGREGCGREKGECNCMNAAHVSHVTHLICLLMRLFFSGRVVRPHFRHFGQLHDYCLYVTLIEPDQEATGIFILYFV